MNYPKSFIDLIKKCQLNYPGTYIGTGNPEGKILIIGKECAIDSVANHAQYILEIVNNLRDWLNNLPSATRPLGTQFGNVDVWVNPTTIPPTYNPLYPYKGQKHNISRTGNLGHSPGTCATWYYYQKLYDLIRGFSSGIIDFHEECFITELNQVTSEYSNHQKRADRRKSIQARQWIFKEPFFNEFPITILACGNDYINNLAGGVENTMDPRWVLIPGTRVIPGIYGVYGNKSDDQILIVVKQLSINVSNVLLQEIANLCKPYFKTK